MKNKKQKKIIIGTLILLTLFISGCTTVIVEAEPPIMNKLSIISDAKIDVDVGCYTDNASDNYEFFLGLSILNDNHYTDLSKTTKTHTQIINNDDLRIIDNLIYPNLNYVDIEAYYKIEKTARNRPNYCEYQRMRINYKLTEYIDNKLISETDMWLYGAPSWYDPCTFAYEFDSCIIYSIEDHFDIETPQGWRQIIAESD